MRKQQECIPVDAYRPLFTIRGGSLSGGGSLSRGLVSIQGVPVQGGLCQGDPPEETWYQAARQKGASYKDTLAVDRITDTRL